MKSEPLKKGSTLSLRGAILALGAVVLFLCALPLPTLFRGDIAADAEYADIAYTFYVILTAVYAAATPFFYALLQAWRLLGYIDKNKAFSLLSVTALKRIAVCAVAISAMFAVSLPFFYVWAQHDDAPGLIVIGMIFTAVPLVIAVFAAVLQRLFKEAIAIKTENDLTV